MKILFFGDSITWCQSDQNNTRIPKEQRWTTMIKNRFHNHEFSFYGVNGMAVDVKPWSNNDWCTTSKENMFVEKIIATHFPDVEHVFLYFGANNYYANFEKPKSANEIANKIKRLHDSITKLFSIKVHIINLQSMNIDNGIFSVESLQEAIATIFPHAISLKEVVSHGKDQTHMTYADNKLIARIIAQYIEESLDS